MAAFVTRRRVEFRDTDAAGIAHFSAFFLWMESAEHELLRAADVRVVEPVEGAIAAVDSVSWPRVSAHCDYTSAVRFGDEVDIAVTVAEIGRTSVTYAFQFSHGGQPVAAGRVVAVRCRMRSGHRPEPVPIPPVISGRLAPFQASASPS
jgi:acyl-CoA thioester hydrolase